ncbi:MAG: sodium:solute symporter [Bacteroidia bacterium]|nr:MAG: sodium:solute symporter [Bacteroidia bacterium]
MSGSFILLFIAIYFLLLLSIAYITSRKASAFSYFLGNKASPWYIVALGMIGDSLSGVTYISVPGKVYTSGLTYLQIVLGYFLGYFIIAYVLLPLYYRLNVTSIYEFLEKRFDKNVQKTGALFFIISRLLGAAGRLYLAANVIHQFVLGPMGWSFGFSISVILILMLLYTIKGGIKTLVWTDALQSLFLVMGVVLSILAINQQLNWSFAESINHIVHSSYFKVFDWNVFSSNFFLKDLLGGIFIAVAMTGLDQNMMQKNLSCKSLNEAQKNIISFSFVMVIVNIFFQCLGVLIYLYFENQQIPLPLKEDGSIYTDKVFPLLALQYLNIYSALFFILGLTAATFSSADSVLTTLTTSFYIDILHLHQNSQISESRKQYIRTFIHIMFTVLIWTVILMYDAFNNKAIVDTILMLAGYTYGPLLAIYAYGIFSKRKIQSWWVILSCFISPLLLFGMQQKISLHYKIGNELIIWNMLLTLLLIIFGQISLSRKKISFT